MAGSRQTIKETVKETINHALQPVREMIGRVVIGGGQFALFRTRARLKSIDQTIPDYEFWDKLRRCKQPGYKLGGLFAKRIESVIAAWVLGAGLTITLVEQPEQAQPVDEGESDEPAGESNIDYTNRLLAEFIHALLDAGSPGEDENADPDREEQAGSLLMSVFKDELGLGEQFIIVNVDGSLSVPSPDTVTVKRDELDYRRVLAVIIETKLDKYTIIDEYRADGRTVTVKMYSAAAGQQIYTTNFENLLGRIPVIHAANGRSSNETNGHPIHEELLPLYDQYDDVLYKQLDGAKLLGNPILAFTGMKDINQVVNANQPRVAEEYTDKDGNIEQRPQLNIESNAVMLVGEGGAASFVAPPVGFTADTKTALKSLFLMLLEHTGIPESVWGGELASARATSDTQLTQFIKEIQGWQRENGGWIVKLCKIWLETKALTDPRIVTGRLMLEWPALSEENKEVRLKYIEAGRKESVLTDETFLTLLELVDDPKTETKNAKGEADERAEQAMAQNETMAYNAAIGAAANEPAAVGNESTAELARLPARYDLDFIEALRELRNSLVEAIN